MVPQLGGATWLTEKEACPGVIAGPTLAGKAAARTNGSVTATQAPSSLTAAFRIEPAGRKSGRLYTFEVWGEADNAATARCTPNPKSPRSRCRHRYRSEGACNVTYSVP